MDLVVDQLGYWGAFYLALPGFYILAFEPDTMAVTVMRNLPGDVVDGPLILAEKDGEILHRVDVLCRQHGQGFDFVKSCFQFCIHGYCASFALHSSYFSQSSTGVRE